MTKFIKFLSYITGIVMIFISLSLPQSAQAFSSKEKKSSDVTDSTKTDSLDNKDQYKELIEKAITTVGLFTIHQVKNDYYFEIADSLMGRDILIVNKISGVNKDINGVGINNGMGFGEKSIRFIKDTAHRKVFVTEFDSKVSSPKNDAITKSVAINYQETVIEYFDIEAYSEDSTSVLIKVNKVFNGKEKSFNNVFGMIGIGGSVNSKLSKIETVKNFPKNIVVKATLSTTHTEQGGSLPITIKVTSNIVLLDKEPMMPRFGDDRVGYFTVPHLFFSDEQQKVEKQELVNRWRMEPKEEDIARYKRGELVEPKKPIIFYIDPATPPIWIPFIKRGVEEWQATFESAGFKNAIYAREVDPIKNKDFDIDDVRYSVITYVASEEANAMGPSVIDPRSGEIIEADIIWWHNVMSVLQSWIRLQTGAVNPQARLTPLAEDLMGNAVRFVSSHELGHSLGLRHNMGASYSIPTDSLRSKSFTESHGTASSIMDYARFNYVAQPEDGITSLTPNIGTYDKHAIEWAYRWYDVKTAHEESPILNKLLRDREDKIEYWYGEQQGTLDPLDPRSQTEDLGDDAIKSSQYGLANLKRIIPHVTDWTFKEGKINYDAGRFIRAIVYQWQMYANHVKTNVGGYQLNTVVREQNIDRYIPVNAEYQRKSVQYIIDEVFTYPEWLFGAEAWNSSYALRHSPDGTLIEYSPLSKFRALQYNTYYSLLADDKLSRMNETEALIGRDNTYTPEDMLEQITESVFEEKGRKKLSIHERLSQKNYVDALIVSSNLIMVKTTNKGKLHLHCEKGCSLMNSAPEVDMEQMYIPRPEEMNSNNMQTSQHFYFMKRVGETTSAKRAEMRTILNIAQKRDGVSDNVTANHYQDLVLRLKEALKEL